MKLANKKICSGCHACYSVCPKHCITMEYDNEGFLQPQINRDLCIDCGRCRAVCPVLNEYKGNPKGMAFACINKNDNIRMQSSSGGVFTLIAEYVLDKGGVVFGAAFDKDLNVKHIEVCKKNELYRLRGSKYVQSSIGDSFKFAKDYLEKGRLVLFSGTPCQISGLKSFLHREYDNLITQDIICHGVPSLKVWQFYLRYQEAEYKSQIDRDSFPIFRRKDEGWKRYSLAFRFTCDKEYRETLDNDLFMRAFLSNVCLRQSCYNCHSKSLERESDITLADFWGINNLMPEMDDDKGTSLVFVNTRKGRKLYNAISCFMKYKEIDIDQVAMYNPSAVQSCVMTSKRKKFMGRVTTENFKLVTEKYTKESLVLRTKIFVKTTLMGMSNKIRGDAYGR